MSQNPCRCPSYVGLSYEEIITVSGLLKRKNESKNCCEDAGYLCPNLALALRHAPRKGYAKENEKSRKTSRTKELRKTKLNLQTR